MSGPGEGVPPGFGSSIVNDFLTYAEVRRRMESAFAELRKDGSGLSLHQERALVRAVLP